MTDNFDLIITADYPSRTAEFSLRDAHGGQLAYRQTDFKTIAVSRQQGLFDLSNFVRHYVEAGQEQAAVAEIGVCIAEQLLGQEIFMRLWESSSQRTLRIQLPGATDTENHLAAALARVPWEIARPSANLATLGERNLLVRVVHDMMTPASKPIALAPDEPLRLLFVFAESRGSRPLGARQERRKLLQLLEKEIYPQRRVVAHFLTHGVTRERLAAQIQEQGGYHIVHWSGHGHLNLLELCKPGGASDHLTGQELLDLFLDAGGFLPRLFFLSACHSGDILRVKDWADFLAVAQGKEPNAKGAAGQTVGLQETSNKDIDIKEQPGYTGSAHALLQGGVPSVVAMRYAVGDDYAREVAVEFYRALLAHAQPKTVAASLTMARQALLGGKKHDPAHFSACDHATPVLYGEEQPGLTPPMGRSPSLNPRNPRLQPIAELTTANHAHFVGRTWELVGLGADFIGSSSGLEVKPIAVITGLGGMGKTALTAEALALWESRFEWVLLYQAKPNRLELESTLRDIHMRLLGELKRYHQHVRSNPADAIYRDADSDAGFTGPARLQRLVRNLLRAMKDEAILLVIDNFETNLKDPDPSNQLCASQDPAWDEFLVLLATELPGSPSRVLVTCRWPLVALTGGLAHAVPLGPLPPSEAALYLREQPSLARMVFGSNAAEQALARRLLNASRFHPLLMDRLAKLAADPKLRAHLLEALETLENAKDFAQLPALFASTPGDTREMAYLNDALATSLDLLIRNLSPDARRLLWIIALSNQPEPLALVQGVWSGEAHGQEQLRRIQRLLDNLAQLPLELQEKLKAMPPELRAQVDALPPRDSTNHDIAPLLAHLVSVGLVTEERLAGDDVNPNLTCHELVRERIHSWMDGRPEDCSVPIANAIRLGYAERLIALFEKMEHKNMSAALEAGSRALIYCVQTCDWNRLSGFASRLITSMYDPGPLEALIPQLQIAAASTPKGLLRASCLCCLADALAGAGHLDASLPLYEQAADQAHTIAEAESEDSRTAWGIIAAINANRANALADLGNLSAARSLLTESAEAKERSGCSAIDIIGIQLESLRLDIIQNHVRESLPIVEKLLAQVHAWWVQHISGESSPEAPDPVMLARVLIGALDVAREGHMSIGDHSLALDRVEATLQVHLKINSPREDIGRTRVTRANILAQMPNRLEEARIELEDCLAMFRDKSNLIPTVLSSLATLFGKQGDYVQAISLQRRALALRVQAPNVVDRTISHNNLANYLKRDESPSAYGESNRHQLAALVYRIVANLGRDIQGSLIAYATDLRRAHAAGRGFHVPRVATLLADPAFAALDLWLRQRHVDLVQLQADVDQFLDQARRLAASQ
jgi:tetratricopeptide (TPR) repeat protein